MNSFLNRLSTRILGLLQTPFRIILDRERRLGNFSERSVHYDVTLAKEEVARRYVLNRSDKDLCFLDVGARGGELTYLLGIYKNLEFDRTFYEHNLAHFRSKYTYFGMDLLPSSDSQVLSGDACDPEYVDKHPEFLERFDVIYSNNVFEHFNQPWIAARNLTQLLKVGGIVITIVPFAQRYHESSGDFYRYTHKGIEFLFQSAGCYEVLESGYDICGRRTNWQGGGKANDIVPVDNFGAWRETWFTVNVMRKLA